MQIIHQIYFTPTKISKIISPKNKKTNQLKIGSFFVKLHQNHSMKPWIMTHAEAYANCCLFGGHRRTVHVVNNQFGLPFIGAFSTITTIQDIAQLFQHPIIIANGDADSHKSLFVGLCFRPRDTQIECYIYTEPGKRILHSSYQIKPYTPVVMFIKGDIRTMRFSIHEGAAPPYTTVCTFVPNSPHFGFVSIDDDVYIEPTRPN